MKKFMTSIKTLAILLIAGAALTACTDDINIIDEQPVDPATQKYTMTVKASKDGDVATKALSLDGTTLNVTWTAGEEVLVYQNGSKIGTLTAAASSTASTTLSGTLDSAPDAGQALTFYFHTAANPSYSGQDGTLTMIASTYDFCSPATVASDDFTVDAGNKKVNVPAGISFGANKQAIAKFTLTDKANDAALNATKLVLKVDLSDAKKTALAAVYSQLQTYLPVYELNPTDATYEANGGTGILFLAIPYPSAQLTAINTLLAPLTLTTEDFVFTLTATVGSDTYTLTKSGFPFENGKYYAITAKMTKLPPATGHALSASVVGDIVGSNGLAYAVEDKDNLPTGVTAVAMVAYKDGSKGLAIELNSNRRELRETTNLLWDDAKSYAQSRPAVSGGTWRMPSKNDWQNMFLACRKNSDTNSASDYMGPIKGFVEKIAATGISWYDEVYWSSTKNVAGTHAWIVYIDLNTPNYARFSIGGEDGDLRWGGPAVLGCLDF